MNPQPLYQHSVCALYRCGYTLPSPYYVTTKQGKKINKILFSSLPLSWIPTLGLRLFPGNWEKHTEWKDSHKVTGHDCKWFSIWLCSGGGRGGGVVLLHLVRERWHGLVVRMQRSQVQILLPGTGRICVLWSQLFVNYSQLVSLPLLWIFNSFCSI